MKVYKNGICREIDQKREQEFKRKRLYHRRKNDY